MCRGSNRGGKHSLCKSQGYGRRLLMEGSIMIPKEKHPYRPSSPQPNIYDGSGGPKSPSTALAIQGLKQLECRTCPDEEGIETALVYSLRRFHLRAGHALMKKGLRRITVRENPV